MDPLRRSRKTTILYHGREYDCGCTTVTLSINGIRWEYTLSSQQADTVEYITKSVSTGKALAFAKSHATASRRLDPLPASTLFDRHRGAQASRAKRMKVTLPNV